MASVYFPIERGIYEVAPGLRPLGFDFGNGQDDARAIQIDDQWARFRDEKLKSRAENLKKYHGLRELAPNVKRAAALRLLALLESDQPGHFTIKIDSTNRHTVECALSQDRFVIDENGDLVEQNRDYANAFDAIFSQIQEDGAIISCAPDRNWLSCLHVCCPSHWDPREKLGNDFVQVHKNVPGSERMLKAHKQMTDAMVNKGPFVRFVWSFVTDTRLNHHPEPPPGEDAVLWKGRSFDDSRIDRSPFYLRIERQVTVGLPEVQAALFLIRLSFIDGRDLRANAHQREQLLSALRSMTPESRVYKGVATCFDQLTRWLSGSV